MTLQTWVARRPTNPLAGYSCWLRSKIDNILGRHPNRVPMSPESPKITFNEDIRESPVFRHPNSDIGVYRDGFQHEFTAEGDFGSTLAEEYAVDRILEYATATNGQSPMPGRSINFSRPLVGRPSRRVAIGLVDWPKSDDLAHLIDSFPLPPTAGPSIKVSSSDFAEAQTPDEEAFFHNDAQFRHIAPSEQSLPVSNLPGSLKIGLQASDQKPNDRVIKRKPVPQQISSCKSQRFTPYPESRRVSLARGSFEGLVRYRKLAKGEFDLLPEIKRLSLLMESFKKFGLGATAPVASIEGDAAASNVETSKDKGKQSANNEPSVPAKRIQPLQTSGDEAVTIAKGELCSDIPDSAFPNPLRSHPASLPEVSYAQYLATYHQPSLYSSGSSHEPYSTNINSSGQPEPASTAKGTPTSISSQQHPDKPIITTTTTKISPARERNTPFRPPTLSQGAQRRHLKARGTASGPHSVQAPTPTPTRMRFNPLTMEDSPPCFTPDLRGEGYRYPWFERSSGA